MSQKKTRAGPEVLSCFDLNWPAEPDFRYMRWYWKEAGPHSGISEAILRKLTPAGHEAARHDLLLPDRAPGEYADLHYLLERYDVKDPSALSELKGRWKWRGSLAVRLHQKDKKRILEDRAFKLAIILLAIHSRAIQR